MNRFMIVLVVGSLVGLVACNQEKLAASAPEASTHATPTAPAAPAAPAGPTDAEIEALLSVGYGNSASRPARISNIIRGEILEATGGVGVPAGTILFPIRAKVDAPLSQSPVDVELYFYKNNFGEWEYSR